MTITEKLDRYFKSYHSSYDLARSMALTDVALAAKYKNVRNLHDELMLMYKNKKPYASDIEEWLETNLFK